MNKVDVESLLSQTLADLKKMDIYSDSFSYLVAELEEDFWEEGADNSVSIVDFYVTVALLAKYGGVSLAPVGGKDFQFGFKEIEPLLEQVDAFTADDDSYKVNLQTQLKVSQLRGISALTSEESLVRVLSEDITLVRRACDENVEDAKVDDKLKKDLGNGLSDEDNADIERLKESSKLVSLVENFIKDVLAVYDEALAPGYDLAPYLGVVTTVDEAPLMVHYNQFKIVGSSVASVYLSRAVSQTLNKVHVRANETQFNLEAIYKAKYPVYFPTKFIEFGLGTRVSNFQFEGTPNGRIPKRVWKNARKEGNGYAHRNAIEDYLDLMAWRYLLMVVRGEGLWEKLAIGVDRPMMPEISNQLMDALTKLRDSACTFAILVKKTGSVEDWASYKLIVSSRADCLGGHPLVAGNELYLNAFSGSGTIEPPLVKDIKGIQIRTYSHIADPAIAEAEPLFAYHALDAVRERGDELSPDSLIMGEGLDGKIIFSKRGVKGLINLHNNLVHVTQSGSRSGKGVQINSQMGPSIAKGRPIFPKDLKPDTSVAYYDLAGGSDPKGTPYGYFIQGGQFSATNIASENPNTAKELDWDNNPKIMGRLGALVPDFWNITTYSGIWGNMAYYRSILLTLGILCLRSKVKASDPTLYEKLGGDEGVVILIDEVSAFMELFMSVYFNKSAWFDKDVWSKKTAKVLREHALTVETTDESKKAYRVSASALEEARDPKFQFKVYIRDLIENYNATIKYMDFAEVAAFNQAESTRSDIYIVGQKFNLLEPKDGNKTIGFTSSGEVEATSVANGVNHLFSFLFNFQSDYIVGYNTTAGFEQQAWRTVAGSDAERYLTAEAKRFAYLDGEYTWQDILKANPAESSKMNAKLTPDERGAVYFKPYLLLNLNEGEPVRQLEGALGEKMEAIKANNSDGAGGWNKAIGVPGFVRSMGIPESDLGRSFTRAREIAEMVIHQMGYTGDYLDFLLDLRPEWNFSAETIVQAFTEPAKYAQGGHFASWKEYNEILGNKVEGVSGGSDSDVDYSDDSSNFGSAYVFGAEDEEVDFDEESTGSDLGGLSAFEGSNGSDDFGSTDSEFSYEDEIDLGTPVSSNSAFGGFRTAGGEQPFATPDLETAIAQPVSTVGLTGSNDPFNQTFKVTPKFEQVPISDEGIDRLAEALGISSSILRSTYLGEEVTDNSGLGMGMGVSSEEPTGRLSDVVNAVDSASNVNDYATFDEEKVVSRQFGDTQNRSEGVLLNNWMELKTFITEDVFAKFGFDTITSISVTGGLLTVNGVSYKPTFKGLGVSGLPVDKQMQFANKQYAEFFQFESLQSLPNLTYLTIDSPQFVLTHVMRPIGMTEADSILKLFDLNPSLSEITVAGRTFGRKEGIDELVAKESVFKSSRRREQVLEKMSESGNNFRRARWNSTQQYFGTKRGWERFWGTSVNLLGAGAGGMVTVTAKTAESANNILRGAGKLFKVLGRELKDEFRK